MRIQEAVVVILAKEMTASFVIRGDVETLIGNLKFDVWYINQKFSISFNLRGLGEPFENNDKLVITPAFKSQIRLNEIFKQRNIILLTNQVKNGNSWTIHVSNHN